MAYQVTARKWRPRKFGEVVAQEHITATLGNALKAGRIAQCYLFCGPRGVGKTTTARVLAKALNCAQLVDGEPCDSCDSCLSIAAGTSMNVLEIDGASNNSVDDVRELREIVRYVPTEGTYKIYIIDEVHMLSTAAFNALLKTLEEPPPHVVFLFATTEVQEVPETILSRCQRFNFRRIPSGQIAAHLGTIAASEGIDADEEALFLLANRADGALRDAESLLDQVVSFDQNKVTVETAQQVLGLVDRNVYFDVIAAIAQAESGRVLDLVAQLVDSGADVEEFVHGLTEHVRHLLCAKVHGDVDKLDVAEAERVRFAELSAHFGEEDVLRMLQTLMEVQTNRRHSLPPRFRLEMTLVRLALMGRAVDVGQLLQRLKQLETALGDGLPLAAAERTAPAPSSFTAPAPLGRSAAAEPLKAEPPPVEHSAVAPSAPVPFSPLEESIPEPPPALEVVERDHGPAGQNDAGKADEESSIAAVGDLDFARIKSDWESLIEDVRAAQPTLGIFLREAALLGLEGRVLRLAFNAEDRFPMNQVGKNREAIEKICEQKWGHSLRLECVIQQDGEAPAQEEDVPIHADPTVKSVLDTFDGELI